MMEKTGYLFISILTGCIILFCGCHPAPSSKEEQEKTVKYNDKVPSFNADSAYYFVKKQVSFGPRIPNTPAHEKCASWLFGKMQSYADSVSVQRTTLSTHDHHYRCINIIGHFNPKAKERILLLAHWDTRPFADDNHRYSDGADNGGSGVADLLEVARQMHLKKPSTGIDLLLTDVEDAGMPDDNDSWGLGTQYWAKKAKAQGYQAQYGILLDMVGGKGSRFYLEGTTKYYAAAQSKMIWDVANSIGYSDYFRYQDIDSYIVDDHYFVNRITGIPTVDIIALQGNGDFMPWHHTLHDNMQIIDKNTLKAVGQTVLYILYALPSY